MTRVYTIGHSNTSDDNLVERLRKHGVRALVDLRSKPFSRYNPQFNRDPLAERLRKEAVPYIWLGHSLGGMPDDPSVVVRGRVDYDKVRATDKYQKGLEDLLKGVDLPEIRPLVLMCSEADPLGCHRRRLVGADLLERGFELVHIMGDGSLQTEHQVRERAQENQPSALDIFGSD